MRSLLATILLLLLLAWTACVLPSIPLADESGLTHAELPAGGTAIWRRTNRGWERADRWPAFRARTREFDPAPAPVHPLMFAGLLVTGSLTALAAFPPRQRQPGASG